MTEEIKINGFEKYQINCSDCNIKKQLKRKKQEFEELKKYRPIIDRLLKQFETYDKLKSLDVVTFAKQTFEQLDQLKQTITEIKEIAEYSKDQECEKCPMIYCCEELCTNHDNLQTIIQQKCEVIKDE